MIKSIYTKWEELEENLIPNNVNVVEYYLSNKPNNRLYLGIDGTDNDKKIYIEFDSIALENYKIPHITGLKITRVKAPYIDDTKSYICVSNSSDTEEVFLAFSATLVENLKDSKSNSSTIEKIEDTIKFYKDYFSNNLKSLSDSEEQGLCAELMFLKELIENEGQLVVNNWLGPQKNKRDFVFENKAIEIKSTLNQLETSITISNENQLDCFNVDELKLVVYILEKNPIGTINVTNCINLVDSLLTDVEMNKVFKAKIISMGINVKEYANKNNYTCESIKNYLIDESFPCLSKHNIPNVCFSVKYKINLNSLDKYLEK